LKLGTCILLHISPDEASSVLGRNDSLLRFISDFIIFQGLECDDLLPYIQKCDPEAMEDYAYA